MKPKANIGKHHIVVLLLSKITVLGSKTHQMNQPKPMAHHCMIRCLASLSFILHNFRLITKLLSLKGSQKVNYSKKTISNSLRFARLTWYIWDSTLRYIAFRHFPDVSFIRPCLDLSFLHCFTGASPLMTPSSPNRPNTKPLTLHLRCCWAPNAAPSGWSSVSGPRPEPGRRHMTWETRMKHANMQNSHHSFSHLQ